MNRLISLRLPDALFDNVEQFSTEKGYTSMQDYIREALRDRIIREKVMALAGSQKGKLLSKQELSRLALERDEKRLKS